MCEELQPLIRADIYSLANAKHCNMYRFAKIGETVCTESRWDRQEWAVGSNFEGCPMISLAEEYFGAWLIVENHTKTELVITASFFVRNEGLPDAAYDWVLKTSHSCRFFDSGKICHGAATLDCFYSWNQRCLYDTPDEIIEKLWGKFRLELV